MSPPTKYTRRNGKRVQAGLQVDNLNGNVTFDHSLSEEFTNPSQGMERELRRNEKQRREVKSKLLHAGIGFLSGAGVGGGVGTGAGAIIGAVCGSIVPGPGTAIGAAVGAAIGGISAGLLGGGAGAGISAAVH